MTPEQTRTVALSTLARIAPEADLTRIDDNTNLRDQLDLDSMDFLNWMVSLSKELKITIPESDYPQLATLRQCIEYLSRNSGAP